MAPCKFKVGDPVRSGSRRGIVTRITTEPVVGAITGALYPNIQQHRVTIPGYSAPAEYFVPDDVPAEMAS
jgi:hypothetical protein